MQLIYKGKTKQSLPKYTFPKDFEVIFNEKHWANESTAISFIENIIVPYVNDEKVLLGLPEAQKTLLVYDFFKGHLTEKVNEIMALKNIVHELVPANMTNLFQPLDITINRVAKDIVRRCYSSYYSGEVMKQISAGIAPRDVKVNLKLSKIKPLHAEWLVKVYTEMQDRGSLIKKKVSKKQVLLML